MWNIKALALTIQMLLAMLKVFLKRSRSQGQKIWFPLKGSVTRNTQVKNQSSSNNYSIVINKYSFEQEIYGNPIKAGFFNVIIQDIAVHGPMIKNK